MLDPLQEVLTDLREHDVPLERGHRFKVDDVNGIEEILQLFDGLNLNTVDPGVLLEVLVNDGHIEVLDSKGNTLEDDSFDLRGVKHEEGELGDSYKAVLGRLYLHD